MRKLFATAAALALLADPALAQLAPGPLPGVVSPTGPVTAQPVVNIGYDSITGFPCIVGKTATCSLSGGGSGGGASYTAAASPFAVSAGVNKPMGISTFNSAGWFIPVKPGTTTEIDLSSQCVWGADGATCASTSNPLPTQAQTQTDTVMTGGVNVKEINGVAPLMGNGVSGTGVQRFVEASDASANANKGQGATGAAVPTGALYQGTSQSGVLAGVIGCDQHAFYDASDNGKKTVVAGVSAKKIYICGYKQMTGGTATNLDLGSGTGTDCVTTYTKIIPTAQLVANDRDGANAAFWNGLKTLAAADNLCGNASAGNAHQWEIWYTVQ